MHELKQISISDKTFRAFLNIWLDLEPDAVIESVEVVYDTTDAKWVILVDSP